MSTVTVVRLTQALEDLDVCHHGIFDERLEFFFAHVDLEKFDEPVGRS